MDNGKVKGVRSTETVCKVTLMDETVYREGIGFDETVIDVSVSDVIFFIVTVSDVKVSWSVYRYTGQVYIN